MGGMNWLRSFVYSRCIRPAALSKPEGPDRQQISGMLILSKHPNPTFSYYLEERISATAAATAIVRDIREGLDDIDPHGLFVVICRYIRPRQLKWLETHRSRLAGIAYFVDDDIAAIIAGHEARWYYKWKLIRTALMPQRRLNPLLTDVWASTRSLAAALSRRGSAVEVLPPYPPISHETQPQAEVSPYLTMIYHATDIHRREHAFIMPIVAAAMRRHKNLRFEVIANGKVARRWRAAAIDKDRLVVRPAMPWKAYLKDSLARRVDISLIPLLDDRINNARSDTKRVDIARSGAAAIFSDCAVYQRCAMPGEVHVANTATAWAEAIDALIAEPGRRAIAREATCKSIQRMRDLGQEKFPGLCFEALPVRKSS